MFRVRDRFRARILERARVRVRVYPPCGSSTVMFFKMAAIES
jgi:hypothetical protein